MQASIQGLALALAAARPWCGAMAGAALASAHQAPPLAALGSCLGLINLTRSTGHGPLGSNSAGVASIAREQSPDACSRQYSLLQAAHGQPQPWFSPVARYAKAAKGGKEKDKDKEEKKELDLKPFADAMRTAIEHLRKELSGIHTGRASPALLENIEVDSKEHGRHVPIKALGTVVARSAQQLSVIMYNSQECQLVAQAIQDSELKLPARVEAGEVLVAMPKLTLEYLQRMVKLVSHHGETAKRILNKVRHDAVAAADQVPGGKDAVRAAKAQVEKVVSEHKAELEQLVKAKEKELKDNH